MRIAVLSDVHGNLTALEAVLADLRETSPDLVLQGGDLVGGGSSPAEVIDCVRELGWAGVFGNSDEAVARPETLEEFARRSRAPVAVWEAVREMTAFTREALGEERIAWLGALPRVVVRAPVALVHASPQSAWNAPGTEATDGELERRYLSLGQEVAVYGHIHQPFVRKLARITVANAGSVSQSFDGEARASYVLIDDDAVSIRRVAYDLEREIQAMNEKGMPGAEWMARTLVSARPQMP